MIRIARGFIVALLLAGCGAGSDPAQAPRERPDPLEVVAPEALRQELKLGTVATAEVRETLRVAGRIDVDETRMARVGSPVSGRITDLAAIVGQNVRRGQVLATINSTELSNAQLGFLKSYSQRLLAERAAGRAQALLDADVIGSAELQRRLAELTQADAEVSAARNQLRVLGMADEAIAKLAVSGTIHSVAPIRASLSGTVIERKVTEGQVVQPADPIYLVADLSHVWVVADIPEQSASLVRVGEALELELPALGRRLAGRLSFVAPTVNPDTRTVRARMELPNPSGEYKPAMLASVFVKGMPQKRLVVPSAAVVRDENRDYVFVPAGAGRFVARPVTLGPEYDGVRVVAGGLRDGDGIVVEGGFHLNNERNRRNLEGS